MYLPTKFGVRSFIRSKVMEGVPHFKFRSRDAGHAHFRGQFVVHWLIHVMVSVSTKNEVSIFGHYNDIKGVPKFRKWSRDRPKPRPFKGQIFIFRQKASGNVFAYKIWSA